VGSDHPAPVPAAAIRSAAALLRAEGPSKLAKQAHGQQRIRVIRCVQHCSLQSVKTESQQQAWPQLSSLSQRLSQLEQAAQQLLMSCVQGAQQQNLEQFMVQICEPQKPCEGSVP
jgi:hypothetical protein